jgi:hypothetical protein
LSHISYSCDKQQNCVYDKCRCNGNSNQVANVSSREQYSNCCPEKDLCSNRKVPLMQTNKDFKPCHLHGAESKHLYDECRCNLKNTSTRNKSSFYVKKQGHDTHFNNIHRLSSGDKSPDKYESPMASDGEVDDKLSDDSRATLNYHLNIFSNSPKKRRLVEDTDVGHKSPEHKTLVEPDSGLSKTQSEKKCSQRALSLKIRWQSSKSL